MKYSIIVPVYNRPEEVGELLESLSNQTLRDFEVIIVEDGSVKTCKDVCDKYADILVLHYYAKENSGPGQSRNYGAERANGEYIIILDSDVVLPKGYVEAMKDGTIPYEMQGKYLDIVLFETERLTKLTENLISLNSCDKSTGRLNLSTFRLYDFIKPIITTFEGKCEKKNVKIDLTLGSKDYYVNADQSKIQQVCYNLLDNAVKFSKEDSTIYIKIVDKGEKIFISIKDEGIGIPKESIAKIWDRFYKTDLSRGKDKTGTGLGLSIVKEMIKAHGENINVISTEGVGTEFIFSLKRIKK